LPEIEISASEFQSAATAQILPELKNAKLNQLFTSFRYVIPTDLLSTPYNPGASWVALWFDAAYGLR